MKSLIHIFIFVMAFGLLGCSATPYRESAGEFLDSSMITAKIKTKLIDDRSTNGFHIRVNTFKGIVYLTGYVDSVEERTQATRIVKTVDGVNKVSNNLIVRSTTQASR